LWDDPDKAKLLLQERTRVGEQIESFDGIESQKNDLIEMLELAQGEQDEAVASECVEGLQKLETLAARLALESMLSGEADANNCYLEIHPGAGGTESQDWAMMLMRMYIRWAETRQFNVEIVDEQSGDEAGIKSATLKLTGHNAYGWAKTESGVHRLVRISPFDANARRHTSFASIWVYPEIDDTIVIELDEKDLRIDTFRASGAGGQHVNKTDSAIRITHIPSNIVVACQKSRSQHQNRAEAYKMLKARLYEQELQKKEDAAKEVSSAKTEIGWGHQIRSYVLHPYKLVKDLRTNVETSNADAVLDGDIDAFLSAALIERIVSGEK
jgi:peptide chain release factor 2